MEQLWCLVDGGSEESGIRIDYNQAKNEVSVVVGIGNLFAERN